MENNKPPTTIYFNPDCSKCREALCILEDRGEEFTVVEYLKDIPTAEELGNLTRQLGIRPEQLVRKSEPLFVSAFHNQKFTDAEWIRLMVENPILIERPIVTKNGKAMIGRPPRLIENIL